MSSQWYGSQHQQPQQMRSSNAASGSAKNQKGLLSGAKQSVSSPSGGASGPKGGGGAGGAHHLMLNQYMQNQNQMQGAGHLNVMQHPSQLSTFSGEPAADKSKNIAKKSNQQRPPQQANQQKQSHNNTFSNNMFPSNTSSLLTGGVGGGTIGPSVGASGLTGPGSFHHQAQSESKKKGNSSKHGSNRGSIAAGIAAAMGGGPSAQNAISSQDHNGAALRGHGDGVGGPAAGNGGAGMMQSVAAPAQSGMNPRMVNFNDQPGAASNHFSHLSSQKVAQKNPGKKLQIQVGHLQSQKQKQSKTTSANSPIASGQQLLMGATGAKGGKGSAVNRQQVPSSNQQLTNNYVGGGTGGNRVHPPQLVSGNGSSITISSNLQKGASGLGGHARGPVVQIRQGPGQDQPGTVQIKTHKLVGGGTSKTANHSPKDSIRLQEFIVGHPGSKDGATHQMRAPATSSGQGGDNNLNLNLIGQLQHNQQSMLFRVSQKQKQNQKYIMEHDSSSEMNINDGTGAELLSPDEEDDAQMDRSKINTIQQTVGTIGSNNLGTSISAKQKSSLGPGTGAKRQQRSRMSHKSGSQGGQSSGAVRTSQRIDGSNNRPNTKATYNQKRIQNSMQLHSNKMQKNQMNQQSSSSFMNNPSINEESIGVPQISQPTNTRAIRTKAPWLNGEGDENATVQVLGSDSSQNVIVQAQSKQKGAALIQAPHFIKVKSKTNANPTRKNSPRFSGKFSVSQSGQNPLRESQISKSIKHVKQKVGNQGRQEQARPQLPDDTSEESDDNTEGYGDGHIDHASQPAGEAKTPTQKQSRHQAKRNVAAAGGIGPNNYYVVGAGGGASAGGQQQANPEQMHQQPSANANQGVRQSIDKKIQNLQQVKGSRIKGSSCKSVHQGGPVPAGTPQAPGNPAAQRIQSGQGKNFQNNNRRLNSPASNLNAATNSINSVAKSHLAQFNKTQYATNTQKNKFDQQKQMFLDMAVQKKIGGIASGKQRRENRNLLMKNQQNQMLDNSNSAVGSMGSMGSLGPLVGIQDPAGMGGGTVPGGIGDMPEAGYHTMKHPITHESSKSNKITGEKLQQMQLSQLQHMHLGSYNPLLQTTGDAAKQSQHQQSSATHQSHQLSSVGGYNFQNMTMSGLSSQLNATNTGGAAQGEIASTQSNFIHQQSKSSGPQQRQKKNASQNHHNQKTFIQKANAAQPADHQANAAGGANQSATYYEQNRQSQPTKGNMIVHRKANPISKTTANVSKNPSIERGSKNPSMGTAGSGAFGPGLMPINVSGGKSMQGTATATTYKMGTQQYRHGGKAVAQTSKVSYNNSPSNRNKGGSLGLAAANIVTGQQQQSMVAHQSQANKRQQQLRQQPIGQPLGDIPLLSKEQANVQNHFQSSQNDNGQMSKHQFGSSHVVGADLLQSGYQPQQQNQPFSKGTVYPPNQSSGGNAGIPPSMTSSKKDLSPNLNQFDTSSPNATSQPSKLKQKVMSQTNSPNEKFESSKGDAILGLNAQYGSAQQNRGQVAYNNKKDKPGAVAIGNSQGVRSGRGLVGTGSGSGAGGASAGAGKPQSTSNSQTAKNKQQIHSQADVGAGQQYFNQYFKQNKKSNFIHSNKYGAYGKYAQIDSPKDSSIERARQNDMIQQEQQVTQMNKQLQNVVMLENQAENLGNDQSIRAGGQRPKRADKSINQGQFSASQNQLQIHEEQDTDRLSADQTDGQAPAHSPGKTPGQVNNTNQQTIIKKIETQEVSQLSPRSKEVYLIKQLIVDCFEKYGKPPKTQLELYKIGKMLGKGAFGKVNLGLHRLTRKLVAIKSINMDFMKEESQKKKIMNEINILKSLRHPNNIKILETFQTDKHHMIVMELCPGGDLLNYVRKRRKLTEKYAKFVFKQIMEGIAYLHEQRVSHRDIKLDNILLDGHGNIKLGDFGVSRKIEENEILFEQCGTPAYIAPEIVKDMGYKGFPVDIWSAGICLFAMLYGNVPFKANQLGDLNTVEQLNQEIEYKDTASEDAIDLMKSMLQKAPKQRATAQDVLGHAWLNDEVDEHIDIFDEQELELIRKEFTYVLQKKKLREFKEQRDRLLGSATSADLPYHQASRRADDLNTEFTEQSIQTHDDSLLKNDSSRSVILCPFNTQTGDKTADKIIAQTEGLMEDKDVMVRFHPRVRELDRNYEKLNNQDFDNGVYHKYAYKQKANQKKDELKEDGQSGIREETIKQSDVQMNNLVAENSKSGSAAAHTARKRRRENADINYHNYYIKINQNTIQDTARLGFPVPYIQKCLRENASNHCTTTYYLLCMDQNF